MSGIYNGANGIILGRESMKTRTSRVARSRVLNFGYKANATPMMSRWIGRAVSGRWARVGWCVTPHPTPACIERTGRPVPDPLQQLPPTDWARLP